MTIPSVFPQHSLWSRGGKIKLMKTQHIYGGCWCMLTCCSILLLLLLFFAVHSCSSLLSLFWFCCACFCFGVFDRLPPALCQNKQQQSNWWKHNMSMVDVDVCSPAVLFGYFAVHVVLLSFHFDFAVPVFVLMFLIDSPHFVQRSSSSVARTFWVTFHR